MSPRQKTSFTHEHAVLGFLEAQPLHAYALHTQLYESPIGQIWHIKQAAFYAVVTRLQAAGYVSSAECDDDQRGRRLLACTLAGSSAFRAWRSRPVMHPRDMRIEFLAKLYFCAAGDGAAVDALCAAQLTVCGRWLAQSVHPQARSPYERAVQAYRTGQIQAILDWLLECQQRFSSDTNTQGAP